MDITEDIHQLTRTLNRVFNTLLFFVVIFASFFPWQSWRDEKAQQIQDLQNIMEMGAKAVDAYFLQMENSMRELSLDIIETDDSINLDHAFILAKLFKENHPELINVNFIRDDGQVLFTAKVPSGPELPTFALESSFIKYRNELQEVRPLNIGQPLISLMGKEWIIPLRFRVHDKEGKLAYLISANLPVEMLQKYWKDAPFTKKAALGLMRDDGYLVSRYPVPEKLEMTKIYGTPRTGALINYLKQEKFPANGYVEGPSSLDGPNYLNTFHRLEHFPITLFIAMPKSQILTIWLDNVKAPYILAAVLLIGVFFISHLTFRQAHTRELERWHASQVLRTSEDRFRKLFELNSAVMLIIDPDAGNIVDANNAASDYYGWPIEQLKQMKFQEINTQSPEDAKNEIERTLLSGSVRHEFQHRISDGSISDVEVFSTTIKISGKTFLYSIIHDINERKLAEEAQRMSEIHLQTIVQTIPDLVWLKDSDGVFLDCNAMFERLYGAEKKDIIGKTDYDFVDRELADFFLEHDRKAMVAGNCSNEEWLTFAADGYRGLFDTIKTPMCNADGKLIGVLGIARNITERKQAEDEKAELEVQNRQLQKAESLGRMAGAVAHHFNNQLQVVMGNLEMALDDQPLGVNSNESLVSAMQGARKAADVSRLMLTYLGQTPSKQEPTDLSEACRQSLTLLNAAAPKGMILNADFPSSGPVIRADTNQMHQILTNLINNAWEAISDNRGDIGLTVKTYSHADIPNSKRFPIDWQPQSIPYACLEVSDNGCGISNKDIDKIFDPFFTTKFTGRGLGLPVVMGIVKAHGGGISVESEPGLGSTFRIFLPISTEELPCLPAMPEAQLTGSAEKISRTESGGTVLLIEDDKDVRKMAAMMLTHLRYKVLEAKDGVEAMEIFQQHQDKIRCVLSDLTMPRMDGWDTLAALRKLSPGIPVVLSSGYDEAQVMAGEHSELPNAFLGKPYQLKGLRETINRVLINMS